MARIAGVDLPRDKKVEIGLTYIFGIGRTTAQQILEKTGVNATHRDRDEHQATDGHRVVPWHPSPPGSPRSRPADAHERPYQEGTAPRDCRQEEGNQVGV